MTPDDMGGFLENFDEKTTTWAEVLPLKGERLFYAQERDAQTDTQIKIRKPNFKIKPDMRIKHDGDIYEIDSIINTASAGRELIIMAHALKSDNLDGKVAAATIESPAEGATIDLSGPIIVATFTMTTGTDAREKIRLQIALDADNSFLTPINDITAQDTPGQGDSPRYFYISPGVLIAETDYRARARQYGLKYGAGPWGPYIKFTTAAAT